MEDETAPIRRDGAPFAGRILLISEDASPRLRAAILALNGSILVNAAGLLVGPLVIDEPRAGEDLAGTAEISGSIELQPLELPRQACVNTLTTFDVVPRLDLGDYNINPTTSRPPPPDPPPPWARGKPGTAQRRRRKRERRSR